MYEQRNTADSPKKKFAREVERLKLRQDARSHIEWPTPAEAFLMNKVGRREFVPSPPLTPRPSHELPFQDTGPSPVSSEVSHQEHPREISPMSETVRDSLAFSLDSSELGPSLGFERASPFPLPSPEDFDIEQQWEDEISKMLLPVDEAVQGLNQHAKTGVRFEPVSRTVSSPSEKKKIARSMELSQPHIHSMTPPARSLRMLSRMNSKPALSRSHTCPVTYDERATAMARVSFQQRRKNQISPVEEGFIILDPALRSAVLPSEEEMKALRNPDGTRSISPNEDKATFAEQHTHANILMLGCGTFNDTVALATLLNTCKIDCSILATEIRSESDLEKSQQLDEFKMNIEKLKKINEQGFVKIKTKLEIDATNLIFHVANGDLERIYNIVYSFFPYKKGAMPYLVACIFQSVSRFLHMGGQFRITLTPVGKYDPKNPFGKYDAALEKAAVGTQLKPHGMPLKWSENHEFFLEGSEDHEFFLEPYEHRRTHPGINTDKVDHLSQSKRSLGCRSVPIASRMTFYTKVTEVQRGLNHEAHSPDSRRKIERDKQRALRGSASVTEDGTPPTRPPSHRRLIFSSK